MEVICIVSNKICLNCPFLKNCIKNKISCDAFKSLLKICEEEDADRKKTLIRESAKDINVIDFEVSPELQDLGEKVISGMTELFIIRDLGVKIGYVISYESKTNNSKAMTDCRKVTGH